MGSAAPGTVLVLLLLEPAEGFDDGFLALRGAPVLRDALHAVVQVAALGHDAGNASAVPVSGPDAETVADVDARGKFLGGDFYVNVRIHHGYICGSHGGNNLHLGRGGGTAGPLGGLGNLRSVDVRIVAFLGGVGDHGRIFRNGGDDVHQVEQKAHQGDAEEGNGNSGGQGFGALLFQFLKGFVGTFNVEAHSVENYSPEV